MAESKCEYLQVGVVNVTKGRGVKKVLGSMVTKAVCQGVGQG